MVSPAFWLLLLGLVSSTSTLQPRTKVDHVIPQELFLDQCTPVPTWTIGGEKAVHLVGNNITVVALLNSSRLFGRKQAARLSSLRNRLYQAGFPDINFFVINSILATDNTDLLQNEAVNIPVYQEQPEAPVRDILGAENDHILVLDRCGRMAYQVITPFSKLIYPYVKAAILSTYRDNPCGFCNITRVDSLQAEEKKTSNYVSDEPVHDDCMFCNINTRIGTNPESHPKTSVLEHREENPIRNSVLLQLQKNDQSNSTTKNQLNQLFIQNLSATQRSTLNEEDSSAQIMALRNARIPEKQEPTRNWNWFEHQKAGEEQQPSAESSGTASVEVINYQEPPGMGESRIKKRKRKYYMTENQLQNHTDECKKMQKCHNALVQEIFLDSNSQEVVNDSMEALVNRTQRLFDWYQRQIENGTSSEEEYEKTNILKEKIIEHYSRLLPWLNFKLAPETDI